MSAAGGKPARDFVTFHPVGPSSRGPSRFVSFAFARRIASARIVGLSVLIAALLGSVLGPGTLRAEKALVPAASSLWKERLLLALEFAVRGSSEEAGERLAHAWTESRKELVFVPDSLDLPFDALVQSWRALPEEPARAEPPKVDFEKLKLQLNRDPRGVDLSRSVSGEPAETRGDSWRYVRVATVARHLFSRLPSAALLHHRARYEVPAIGLAAQTHDGDDAKLRELVERYPFTASGVAARERLGDRALESGLDHLAVSMYGELLALGRDQPLSAESVAGAQLGSGEDRARVGQKLCVALLRQGRRSLFELARDEIEAGLVASDRAGFRAAVETLAVAVGARPPPGLPGLPEGLLERSWESSGWSRGVRLPIERGAAGFGIAGRIIDDRGVEFPFLPSERGDEILISGVHSLYRLDARAGAGKILGEIEKPEPLLTRGVRSFIDEDSDSPLYRTTRWRLEDLDGSSWLREFGLAGALPRELALTSFISTLISPQDYMGYDIRVPLRLRSLCAFDLQAGRVLWRTNDARNVDQRNPFGPNQVPVTMSYTSEPRVVGSRVWAGGWREEGYVDGLLRTIDLASGQTVNEIAIASAQMEMTMFGELAREPFASFLVERDGVLFYQSQLGVVAAIDTRDGEILWSLAYNYVQPKPTMRRQAVKRDLPWSLNEPIFLGDLLLVAPRDGLFLYAIDTGLGPGGMAKGGRVLWQYDNSGGDLRDLLGFHEGRLYFSSLDGVAALDLREMSPSGHLPARAPAAAPGNRRLRAIEKRDVGSHASEGRVPEPARWIASYPGILRIPAAGTLTQRGLLVAAEGGLTLVDFDLARRTTLSAGWPGDSDREYAGRVSVRNGLVIVTSNRRVTAFGEPLR